MVGRIPYRPDAGPEDTLVFRHYNASESVHGRTMEEWLRFSPCYFNLFRYFGSDDHYGQRTHMRPWDDGYSWNMKHGGMGPNRFQEPGKGYDMGKGDYMGKCDFMDKGYPADMGKGGCEPMGMSYYDMDCGKGGAMKPFDGPPSMKNYNMCRSWDEGSRSFDNYRRRMYAAFEFFGKLGTRWYSACDRDFAPEGNTWEETDRMLEEATSLASTLQREHGMRPLYFAADLWSHPRYMNGAATNPDAHVFAFACMQVKRAMDMAKRLQAEHFVFFHPRDGYQSPLQRQMYRDMQHMGHLYRMAVQYREKIGYKGHFLIQPKPFDPRRYQYECDAMSTMHMLRHFGLERHFKLYVKPAWSRMMGRPSYHDVYMASAFNMLGMVDASDSYPEVSGTSDICARDIRDATYIMKCYMEQQTGSYKSGMMYGYGGFTMSCRLRRESIEPRDMFHGMILTMDTYARALKNAARMISDGCFARNLQQRYITYKSGFGERLDKGQASFEECEDYIRKYGECQPQSSRIEHFDNMFNYYVFPPHRYNMHHGPMPVL